VSVETARPQDVDRSHRRRAGTPAPETEALLELYRATMRAVRLGGMTTDRNRDAAAVSYSFADRRPLVFGRERPCRRCHATGAVRVPLGSGPVSIVCPACHGTGSVPREPGR